MCTQKNPIFLKPERECDCAASRHEDDDSKDEAAHSLLIMSPHAVLRTAACVTALEWRSQSQEPALRRTVRVRRGIGHPPLPFPSPSSGVTATPHVHSDLFVYRAEGAPVDGYIYILYAFLLLCGMGFLRATVFRREAGGREDTWHDGGPAQRSRSRSMCCAPLQ